VSEDIFEKGDPFDDPAWRRTTKRRAGRFIGCSVPWLAWVLPLVKSKEQLALALCVYRRCCVQNSNTVTVPTEELTELGIGRWAKYHLVPKLEQVGLLRVLESGRGTIKVQLLHWPDPPRS
jgi:hypothetical protein